MKRLLPQRFRAVVEILLHIPGLRVLPQVLENERKKKADAEAKIKALEERLAVLK